jgi:glycosyltransferase involved in cell wall biosynthesis
MINILHITPHFGGGVGTVLFSLISELHKIPNYHHEIVSLEYANSKAKEWGAQNGVTIYEEVSPTDIYLHQKMQYVDIVHLHFWNHPLLYHLLHSFAGKRARVIIWSHVNGHHAPYLFNDYILDFPLLFVTSTPYSSTQKNIIQKKIEWKKEHFRCVHSCSDINEFDGIIPVEHEKFNVGYIGTVDYSKMHHRFLDICEKINIPDVHFIVVGGDSQEDIYNDTEKKRIVDKFSFTGKVDDIKKKLAFFDLFFYPLNRKNYGTGEQVLIEAMSAGIPQVVFSDGPEEYVVQDGITGFVVDDEEDFVVAVKKLYKDRRLLKKMSLASKRYAKENFTINKSVTAWISIYNEALEKDKEKCIFKQLKEEDFALSLFLSALGDCEAADIYRKMLNYFPSTPPIYLQAQHKRQDPVFCGKTKGSVKHYNRFFKNHKLRYISEQI